MIVDDEEPIRVLLRDCFEREGHNIIEAKDGLDGLEKARNLSPDLIFLDVMMPKLNGFDVAASLKNDPQYKDIPIIMLTIVNDAKRVENLGIDCYLSKPFDPDVILQEASSLLRTTKSSVRAFCVGQKDVELVQALDEKNISISLYENQDTALLEIQNEKPRIIFIEQNSLTEPFEAYVSKIQSFYRTKPILRIYGS